MAMLASENDNKENKRLSLDSIMCPICLDVMCMPVTMSCKHEMCKECYDFHFEKANFCCPMCKRRLSTWARKAVCENRLINHEKWNLIQQQYPDLIKQKAAGNDVFAKLRSAELQIAEPGELKEEYLNLVEKFDQDQRRIREQEEAASLKLIKEIQDEDDREMKKRQEEQRTKDEQLAMQLTKELKMEISPSRVNRIILRPKRKNANDKNSGKQSKKK